jgi:hypothetical protein
MPESSAGGKEYAVQGGFFQGAYVFRLTLTGGFELRGEITHQENATWQEPYPQPFPYYGVDSNYYVNRALYIGNTLYTISNSRVQLNSLDNLSLTAKVDLT